MGRPRKDGQAAQVLQHDKSQQILRWSGYKSAPATIIRYPFKDMGEFTWDLRPFMEVPWGHKVESSKGFLLAH